MFAFEDLDGEGAVGVVLLHVGGVLHGDAGRRGGRVS